jgi:hypothetical protein
MKINAQMQEYSDTARNTPMFGMAFALGFAALLLALAGIGAPVQAGSLNDSISPLVSDMASLFVPILALIIAAVPVIIAGAFISFMVGLLAAILSRI